MSQFKLNSDPAKTALCSLNVLGLACYRIEPRMEQPIFASRMKTLSPFISSIVVGGVPRPKEIKQIYIYTEEGVGC